MRRSLLVIAAVALAALGGVWAASAFAPCALPPALLAKFAPDKAASCPAEAAAAEQPAAPPPPAVSVAPAERREFVDRLFVSGTLVARDEAMVGARIDGLSIVELDAEDGDWSRPARSSRASIEPSSTRCSLRTTRPSNARTQRSSSRAARSPRRKRKRSGRATILDARRSSAAA